MDGRIVHLCYAGTSGASRVALNIARGSANPRRHAYVLLGAGPVRADYADELNGQGCLWQAVRKRPGLDWMAYRQAALEMRRLRPSVAILHGSRLLPVAVWLRLMGRSLPLVAVQHGPSREVTECPRRWVCATFSALADRTVTVSHDMERLIGLYPCLRRACGELTVIPNGVDTAFWRAAPPTIRTHQPLRLGMVAALEDYKDHPTLLRAVGQLHAAGREVLLHLVGDGREKDRLAALARELGLSGLVRFEGDLPRDSVRHVVHGLDILVHATRSEAFPMAVLEGMASGRPIVATDVPGVREVVQDGQTGLLTPPGDAGALAEAICRLADAPDLARSLAAAAQARAEEFFDLRRMAKAYEALADSLPE